jgi:hypothetical protein
MDSGMDRKERERARLAAHYLGHKEEIKDRSRNYWRKNYIPKPKPLLSPEEKEANKKASKKAYYERNPAQKAKEQREYYARHPGRKSAWRIAQLESVKQATPAWSDLDKIGLVYIRSWEVSKATGVEHHVDHIVPIKGKTVCGLHVHYNLQVITGSENCKKSNKMPSSEVMDAAPVFDDDYFSMVVTSENQLLGAGSTSVQI